VGTGGGQTIRYNPATRGEVGILFLTCSAFAPFHETQSMLCGKIADSATEGKSPLAQQRPSRSSRSAAAARVSSFLHTAKRAKGFPRCLSAS
jgi:hypothetical protein